MQRLILWLTLACGVLLTGCASVAGGNTQKMYVQAQAQDGAEVTGADCALSNDKGTWRVRAPGDTSIVRSNKRMEVKCEKSPMPQGVVSVESSTRAALFGNIIIGGVVGAVIDHTSGAAYEYPEMIRVVMGRVLAMDVPKGTTPAATAEAMKKANTRPVQQASAQPYSGSPPPRPVQQPVAQAYAQPVPQPAIQPVSYTPAAPAGAARKPHSRALPPASGFADGQNVEAVPLRQEGKDRYAHYLTLPSPKAFVVYETGGWRFWFNSPDSMTTLLDGCAREGRKCWLYAVDEQVVWQGDQQQRIGRADQLRSP